MKFPFWPNPSGYRNIKFGLDRVYDLLERLGSPHQKLPPTIHIAGTNGKGSSLSYLKAIFQDANLKVHRYTSPHLVYFNERIILAGQEISDNYLDKILAECQKASEIEPKINVTFFEGITVAAFLAFSRVKADILLLETGMGGRLDATNVVENPIATIITPVSLDHTDFLGDSLEKISYEKAGIIKRNIPVIISEQKPPSLKVIKNQARISNSKTFVYGNSWKAEKNGMNIDFWWEGKKIIFPLPNLEGRHQIINASCAIATIYTQKNFKISQKNIENGIKNTIWPARMQKIICGDFYASLIKDNFVAELYLDGGHNVSAAKAISLFIKEQNKVRETKDYFIYASLKDKDSKNFLEELSKQISLLVAMEIKDEKSSKTTDEIIEITKILNIKSVEASSFIDACKVIKEFHSKYHSDCKARIIICGSLYFAGVFLEEQNIITATPNNNIGTDNI